MSSTMSWYRYSRSYVGPVKACVMDWSGTTVDKYVISPAAVFLQLFGKRQVAVTIDEARQSMGQPKDVHIAQLTQLPSVRQRWQDAHGRPPSEEDVKEMFEEFVPTQMTVLRQYCGLLPGTIEATNRLRQELGVKIGITTGFVRTMGDVVLAEARSQGFEPDADVCRDEVRNGRRPSPAMLYKNLDLLDVHPIQAVVKVDDSTQGMEEALNAGCWAVGMARYSAYMGIDDVQDEASLSQTEIDKRCAKARDVLWRAGAHYVIDTIAELPDVVIDINKRLARGDKP